MPKLTVSVNGSSPVRAEMDHQGVLGMSECWNAMVGGVVFEFDTLQHDEGVSFSLTADNSRNDPTLRPVIYKGDVDGMPFEHKLFERIPAQPIMTRLRFTWGAAPPRRRQTFFEFAPLPKLPAWSPADWTISRGLHGPLTTPMTDTGSGEDRSCDVPNWYGSDEMVRAYGDAEGLFPVAVREAVAPYAPIGRDGFQTGYNAFSHAAYKAGQTAIGMKFQLPHAVNASVLAYELFGDAFYYRSVMNLGRYAAMYNGGNWGDFSAKQQVVAFSETRGLGRGLNLMLHAWRLDKTLFLYDRITACLRALDRIAGDPMSIPAMVADELDKVTKKPTGRKFVQYWQMSFIFYALDLAIRTGIVDQAGGVGMAYLEAAMDFQERLTARGETPVPYRAFLIDPAKSASDLSNWEPLLTDNRESDCFIIGEIMRRHGRRPPVPLERLMQDQSLYPIRNNAAHFIYDSTRPKRAQFGVTYGGKKIGVYERPSLAVCEGFNAIKDELLVWDFTKGPYDRNLRIAAE